MAYERADVVPLPAVVSRIADEAGLLILVDSAYHSRSLAAAAWPYPCNALDQFRCENLN
jgi:hypothetical protein